MAALVATLALAFGNDGVLTWPEYIQGQYAFLGIDETDWDAFRAFDQYYAPVARWTDVGGGTDLDPWDNARPRLRGFGRNRIAIHYGMPDTVGWFIIGDGRLDKDVLRIGVNIIPTLTKIVQVTTDQRGVAWLYLPLDLGYEETAYFQYWSLDGTSWSASNGLEMHTNLPLPEKRSSPTSAGTPGLHAGPGL